MGWYQKFLIAASILGLIGIPIFVLDWNDLTWMHNREVYWGMIALVGIIGAVLFLHKADVLDKKLKEKAGS